MGKTRKSYIVNGVLPVLLAATCWAINYFIRKCIAKDIGTYTVVFMNCAGAAGFLYIIGPLRYAGLWSRFRKRWKILLVMSFLSASAGACAMTFGLQHIGLGIANIFEKTQVIFTVILAALFLKEHLRIVSIFLGVIGLAASVGLVPSHSGFMNGVTRENLLGILAVVAAAFSWAVSGVMARNLARDNVKAFDIALIRVIIGMVTILPLVFLSRANALDILPYWRSLLLAGLGGLIGAGIGYLCYYHSLKILPAGIASMLELFQPVVGVALGMAFFQEQLTLKQWMASLVLLTSIAGLIWVEARHKNKSSEITDEQL